MKTRLPILAAALVAVLPGLALTPSAARADTVNWATVSYTPNAATATQKTQVQTVNGTNIAVQFSNSTYDSTYVQSPGAGTYASSTSGNANSVYSNGGTTGTYGLQLVSDFSTSTNIGSSGSFIGGASDTVTIYFSQPVINVSFSFYDVDAGTISGGVYTDYVSNIFGLAAGNATVAPILTAGTDNKLSDGGTTLTGTASANQNSGAGNASVVFGSTPITQFSYTYGDTATAGSTHSPIQIIALGNIGFTAVPEPSVWVMLGLGTFASGAAAFRQRRRAAL